MYKFIKILFHTNPLINNVAYLYQDIPTQKYYLSYTNFNNENVIDNSNQYMLINNEPKIYKKKFLTNIDIVKEVTQDDFKLNKL
jgi:hypothetical protein